MVAAERQIATIFPANPVRGLRGGDGLHVRTALRDIATFHLLNTGGFAFSNDNQGEPCSRCSSEPSRQ